MKATHRTRSGPVLTLWTLFLLGACHDSGTAPDSEATPGPLRARTEGVAVVATVASDYTVGALAVVDEETWAVEDAIATVSSDPAVMADGGWLFLLNRYGFDNVRLYEPGALEAPVVEFSVGDRANPQVAMMCAGGLFVTLHSRDYLPVYDPATAWMIDEVDLSDFDDGDGSPEAATMVRFGDTLYVALEQFDQLGGWMPAGGTIVKVDCRSRTVLEAWDAGNAPTVHPYPGREDALIVRTGVFFTPQHDLAFDGAIRLFDVAEGRFSAPLVEEETIQENLGPVAASRNGKAVFITSDARWQYGIYCLDLEAGTYRVAERTDLYLASIAADDRGQAWIAARPGPADPGAGGGIIVYDIDRCERLTGEQPIALEMPPYSLTFL